MNDIFIFIIYKYANGHHLTISERNHKCMYSIIMNWTNNGQNKYFEYLAHQIPTCL